MKSRERQPELFGAIVGVKEGPNTDGSQYHQHGPQPQWHALEETFVAPEDKLPGYGGQKAFRLIQDWLDCIRTGRRDLRNGPEPMLRTLELIDAIYQSSREGRRIECRIG